MKIFQVFICDSNRNSSMNVAKLKWIILGLFFFKILTQCYMEIFQILMSNSLFLIIIYVKTTWKIVRVTHFDYVGNISISMPRWEN